MLGSVTGSQANEAAMAPPIGPEDPPDPLGDPLPDPFELPAEPLDPPLAGFKASVRIGPMSASTPSPQPVNTDMVRIASPKTNVLSAGGGCACRPILCGRRRSSVVVVMLSQHLK